MLGVDGRRQHRAHPRRKIGLRRGIPGPGVNRDLMSQGAKAHRQIFDVRLDAAELGGNAFLSDHVDLHRGVQWNEEP